MKRKRIACMLIAAVLVPLAAGCGGAAPNKTDTDAVAAAVEKFRGCTSFTATQVTEIEELISVEGEEIECNVLNKMEINLISDASLQMKTETSSWMEYDGEQMEQLSVSYIVPENEGYAEYFSDGGEWYKLTTDEDVSLLGMGASSVVDTFFTDRIAFCKVAEESAETGKIIRYEGVFAKEDVIALLESNGQLGAISSMSENQQARIKSNLLKDIDELKVSVWLDEEQGYPVRFEVNMTETLNDMGKSIAKSLGNKITGEESELENYTISMTLSHFDALEQIILPPEAKDAKLYETN